MNLEIKAVTETGEGFGFHCKQFWIDMAEVIDSLRIFPRLFACAYLALLIWITWYFPYKYFGLPASERTVALTTFAGVVLTAAYGAFPFVLKIYLGGGRDWDGGKNAEAK